MLPSGSFTILWNLLLIPAVLTNAKDVCENMYQRYCRSLSADKCYLAYNQKLCCRTCRDYQMMYSYAATEADGCEYGDREGDCARMDSNLCYNIYNRYACCATCARVRTNMEHCKYGDKDVHQCSKVKAYHCYKPDVEKKCCGTCAKYHTGRDNCPYGDRIMFFKKSRKKYSCAAYVGHFGYAKCKLPWEPDFRQICCGSCHDKFSRFDYYK